MAKNFELKLDHNAVQRLAEDAVRTKVAPELQKALDEVHTSCAGKPVDEVKPVLQRRWAAIGDGYSLTDPHLTAYAEAISEGRRVVVEYGGTA